MTLSIAALLAQVELPHSETAALDAQLLLAHVLKKPRTYLMTWPDQQLSAAQLESFHALLARRRAGEPVAHLLGEQGFWSLDLLVNADTLIPRPDTERLVEVALDIGPPGHAEVLDLGTGTGAIALALATERPQWQLTGADRIASALELAERNRQRLKLHNVQLVQSDWFSAFNDADFGLIVSNPPYIAEDDPHLSQGDVRFEPISALVSGADGLDGIRHLVEQAPMHLRREGWLLMEHGWQQAGAVRELLTQRGFTEVRSWLDLAGHQRISGGQWRG